MEKTHPFSLVPFDRKIPRDDLDLLNVLVFLLELDLSVPQLNALLDRVRDIYPKVRVMPPGWDKPGKSDF